MKNFPLLVGTILFTIFLVVGIAFLFSGKQQNDLQPVEYEKLVRSENNNVVGPEDSGVTIVEYSDFQCPACAATEPLVKDVIGSYPQVKLIYRHFPLLNIHPNAQIAAQASEAAADFNQFWPMHDILFDRQSEWSELEKDQILEKFTSYAQELQIDKNEFLSKIESQDIKQRVDQDAAVATSLKLQGTPTFFVNGIQTSAPQLKQTVESLLNNQ